MNRKLCFVVGVVGICWGFLNSAFAASKIEHVIVVSFDQAAPFNIQAADMPLYKKMAEEGARTWNAYTIVPSITLPSHTSMLTGVGIQKHQITWNDWDEKKGVVQVPTIFALAKQKGLTTAIFASKEKFKTLNLPGSLDMFSIANPHDAKYVAEEFSKNFIKQKYNLTFVHFGDPDWTGHQFGVRSPEKMKALAECDAALKEILQSVQKAGCLDSTVFILTSDHGGHDVVKDGKVAGKHGDPTTDDVTIPWVTWGAGVKKNFTITNPVVIYDTAATALWLLDVPATNDFWGRPVMQAYEASK